MNNDIQQISQLYTEGFFDDMDAANDAHRATVASNPDLAADMTVASNGFVLKINLDGIKGINGSAKGFVAKGIERLLSELAEYNSRELALQVHWK